MPGFFQRYFRCVEASADGQYVTLFTEDLPPHRSYYYGSGSPNYEPFDTSRGPQYHPNPNQLSAKQIRVQVPIAPADRGLTISPAMVDGVVGTDANEYRLGPVGVALDGVALFNALAAPGDSIDQEKYTFDRYNAHPTDTGSSRLGTTSTSARPAAGRSHRRSSATASAGSPGSSRRTRRRRFQGTLRGAHESRPLSGA